MNTESVKIEITFDVRRDSRGKDPDYASSILKSYHKLLWNKKLPNGETLVLRNDLPNHYLLGVTASKEISLSSDTLCNSYAKRKRMQSIIQPHSESIETFREHIYRVGGFILFPAKKVNKLNTINQERGWIKSIDDRFDLTLECIRLYYLGLESPLSAVLTRYHQFFELFVDFKGYVEFFLLQDLLTEDLQSIKFFLTGGLNTKRKALPGTSDEYLDFMQNAQAFLAARNQRILRWVNGDKAKS